MKDLEISLATAEDVPALAAVELAAATIFPPGIVPGDVAEESLPPAILEEARAAGRLWVARRCGRPVGFLAAGLLDGTPFVIELDVHPDHQRRGIGTALLEAAAAWAAGTPARALTLTTFRHVPWNAPFYARLGFVEIPPPELGPGLRAQLADEAHRGLDPAQRVAMRLRLGAAGTAAGT